MKITVQIYGFVRVTGRIGEYKATTYYYGDEGIRDEQMMLFAADYPEDGFYCFDKPEEIEV